MASTVAMRLMRASRVHGTVEDAVDEFGQGLERTRVLGYQDREPTPPGGYRHDHPSSYNTDWGHFALMQSPVSTPTTYECHICPPCCHYCVDSAGRQFTVSSLGSAITFGSSVATVQSSQGPQGVVCPHRVWLRMVAHGTEGHNCQAPSGIATPAPVQPTSGWSAYAMQNGGDAVALNYGQDSQNFYQPAPPQPTYTPPQPQQRQGAWGIQNLRRAVTVPVRPMQTGSNSNQQLQSTMYGHPQDNTGFGPPQRIGTAPTNTPPGSSPERESLARCRTCGSPFGIYGQCQYGHRNSM